MWLTRQPFNETPENSRIRFTTATAFEIDSLFVVQGAVFVENYRYLDTQTIEFDAPPDPANGTLLWAGLEAFGTPGLPTQFPEVQLAGFVDADTFLLHQRYAPETFAPGLAFVNWADYLNFISGVMLDAEWRIRRHLASTTLWADAVAQLAVDPATETLLLYTMRQALTLLAQQQLQARYAVALPSMSTVKSETVTFEGAGSIETTYQAATSAAGGAPTNLVTLSEMELLDRLFCPLWQGNVGPFGLVLEYADMPEQVDWYQRAAAREMGVLPFLSGGPGFY